MYEDKKHENHGPVSDSKSRRQRMHEYIKNVMRQTYHHVSRGASHISSMISLHRGKSHEGKGHNHNHDHKDHGHRDLNKR